ncbi:MAG TPA: hypothetical protein VKH34_09365 [Vicinamibacterales bacterium]|nr:hypothetical protein [Vicinamibacterales bacterium]
MAIGRRGDRLAPLEPRLRRHRDPDQRDRGETYAGDYLVGPGVFS